MTAWVLLAGVSGILARKDNNFNNPDEQVAEDDTETSIGASGDEDEDEDGEESGTEEGPSGEEEGTEEKPEGEEEGTDKDTGSEETTPGEEKPAEGSEEPGRFHGVALHGGIMAAVSLLPATGTGSLSADGA